MHARNNDWMWMYLGVALLATAFAFVIPDAAFADECYGSSTECDYEVIGPNYTGYCGVSHGTEDPLCSCWFLESHQHNNAECMEEVIEP